jgi:hypothetical protein
MRTQSEFSSAPSTTSCHSGYRIALLITCFVLGAPPARPAEDPKEIVRQALRNDTRNRELERSYTYTLREETSMPVWVIEGEPHKGHKFHTKMAVTFASKMRGRIWVTKDGCQAVRVDAETIDTITFGGFLARINKGTRIHVEYTYVNGEVWLPKRETFTASARLLLLKGFHQEGDSTFSNYEKFTIDSRFIGDR